MRQECVLSGFIFVLNMDWVMQHTNDRRRGLRWKFTSVLEDWTMLMMFLSSQADLLISRRRPIG